MMYRGERMISARREIAASSRLVMRAALEDPTGRARFLLGFLRDQKLPDLLAGLSITEGQDDSPVDGIACAAEDTAALALTWILGLNTDLAVDLSIATVEPIRQLEVELRRQLDEMAATDDIDGATLESSTILVGGLQFILMCQTSKGSKSASNPVVDRVPHFLKYTYDLKRRPEHVRFLNRGTTSVILQLDDSKVLKLLKLEYYDNVTLRNALSDSIETMKRVFGIAEVDEDGRPVPSDVDTYCDSEIVRHQYINDLGRYNLLDYVKYVQDQEWYDDDRLRAKFAVTVCAQIAKKLARAAAPECNCSHLDLSPQNVMIKLAKPEEAKSPDQAFACEPILIDWGRNSLVLRRQAALGQISTDDDGVDLRDYIAKELLRGAETGCGEVRPTDFLADAFSLGVLFTKLLARTMLAETTTSLDLDDAWVISPDLAEIAETLTQDSPDARRILGADSASTYFDCVADQMYKALRRYEKDPVPSTHSKSKQGANRRQTARDTVWRVLKGFFGLMTGVQIESFARGWNSVFRSAEDRAADENRAGAITRLVFSVVASVLGIVATGYIAAIANWNPILMLVDAIAHPIAFPSHFIAWAKSTGLFPFFLVSLAFTTVPAYHYVSIWGNLRLSSRKPWLAALVYTMAFVFVIPTAVLWVLYQKQWLWPDWAILHSWPIFSGVGLCLIAAVDGCVAKYMVRPAADSFGVIYKGEEMVDGQGSTAMKAFIHRFKRWPWMMLVYGVINILVGLAMIYGGQHDSAVYAGIVYLVNLIKLGWDNCVEEGPGVRTGLTRSLWALRHRQLKREPNAFYDALFPTSGPERLPNSLSAPGQQEAA